MVLTTILLLIMLFICAALLDATINGYSMTRKYQKGVAGYYTSDKKLNKALDWVQQKLTACEGEVRDYINKRLYEKTVPYTSVDKVSSQFITDSGFLVTGNMSTFYSNVYNYWENIKGAATDYSSSNYKVVYNKFLNKLYTGYYFLLVNDFFKNNEAQIKSKDVMNITTAKKILDVVSGDDYASGAYKLSDIINFSKDNDANFDNADDSDTSKDADKKFTMIQINNPQASDSDNAKDHETSILTRLIVKVPQVKFVITRNRDTIKGYDIDKAVLPMANAITANKNIIVKNGAKVTINGDVFAKGESLSDGYDSNYDAIKTSGTVVEDTDKLLNNGDTSDPSNTEFYKDDYDTNFGGVRVGLANAKAAAASSELVVNGSLYSPRYVHAVGRNSKLQINKYLKAADTNKTDATDGIEIKNKLDGYFYSVNDTNYAEQFTSYSVDGGDVFCRKLKSEETATGAAIDISGKAVVDGAVQFDGDSSSLAIGKDLYGLNSGSRDTDQANDVHSCIIENGDGCNLTINGKVFLPGVLWLDMRKLYKKAGLKENPPNYQTAESVRTANNDTLVAYTDFGEGVSHKAYGSAFDFIEMEIDKKVNHFITYFSDMKKFEKTKITNVYLDKPGYILGSGVAMFKDDVTKTYKPGLIVKNGDQATKSQNFWFANRDQIIGDYNNKVALSNDYYKPFNFSSGVSSLDKTYALIAKKSDASRGGPLEIYNDGSHTGIKDSDTSAKYKMEFENGGILITDRDVVIKGGSTIKGIIATDGNVIFDNDSGAETKVSYDKASVYYQEPVDGQLKAKGHLVGYDPKSNSYEAEDTNMIKALGGTFREAPYTPVGEVRVTGVYRSDKMAKFSIDQWKKTS